MNYDKEKLINDQTWRRLEEDHERLCSQDPQYHFLKDQIQSLLKELTDELSIELVAKFMEYDIKKNLLTAIEVEAAYRQGKYITYRFKES